MKDFGRWFNDSVNDLSEKFAKQEEKEISDIEKKKEGHDAIDTREWFNSVYSSSKTQKSYNCAQSPKYSGNCSPIYNIQSGNIAPINIELEDDDFDDGFFDDDI